MELLPPVGWADVATKQELKEANEAAEAAGKDDIYFQLVVQHHGQVSTTSDSNWDANPYNAKNGGFLKSPQEFFTNWNEYEGPFGKKLRLTLRNRWLTIATLKGCCGHPGEPGC